MVTDDTDDTSFTSFTSFTKMKPRSIKKKGHIMNYKCSSPKLLSGMMTRR